MQQFVHYFLHFVAPAFLALKFYPDQWKRVYLFFLATMLIDLDHLLATPIFDPQRCSIGFHPLHSFYAIAIYVALYFVPKYRIISFGCLFHILTDSIDCLFTFNNCHQCFEAFKQHLP